MFQRSDEDFPGGLNKEPTIVGRALERGYYSFGGLC